LRFVRPGSFTRDDEELTWKCPECNGRKRITFETVRDLIWHAESNACSLAVLKGPLRDALWAVEIYLFHYNSDPENSNPIEVYERPVYGSYDLY
jgi:hypothetical protein